MVGRSAEGVLSLVNGVRNELPGMPVLKPVIDLGALLAGGDHSGKPHLGQMLGHRGRRLPGLLGKGVDGKFAAAKGQDQPHPGGVRQHGKDFNRQLHVLAVGAKSASTTICIHTQILS